MNGIIMNGKSLEPRFIFPPNVGSSSARPGLKIDLSTSLVHEEAPIGNHAPNEQQNMAVCRLLWCAFQKPIGIIGIMILFLSWLIFAMATSASVLSWIGTIGVVSGATLIGLSLFSSYSGNARTNNAQVEEVAYGYSGTKKS
jgi:type IV secretory pathway VirB2 component (pilin)